MVLAEAQVISGVKQIARTEGSDDRSYHRTGA